MKKRLWNLVAGLLLADVWLVLAGPQCLPWLAYAQENPANSADLNRRQVTRQEMESRFQVRLDGLCQEASCPTAKHQERLDAIYAGLDTFAWALGGDEYWLEDMSGLEIHYHADAGIARGGGTGIDLYKNSFRNYPPERTVVHELAHAWSFRRHEHGVDLVVLFLAQSMGYYRLRSDVEDLGDYELCQPSESDVYYGGPWDEWKLESGDYHEIVDSHSMTVGHAEEVGTIVEKVIYDELDPETFRYHFVVYRMAGIRGRDGIDTPGWRVRANVMESFLVWIAYRVAPCPVNQ